MAFIPNTPGINFMSREYYSVLEESSKKLPMDKLMRENWLNMMIVRVESAKNIIQSGGDLHPRAKQALQMYEVLEVTTPQGDMKKKLFMKPSVGVYLEVVPLMETFPVVTKAHLMTNHGGKDKMTEWLTNSNITVSHICTDALLKVCKLCLGKERNQEEKTQFNDPYMSHLKIEIPNLENETTRKRFKGSAQVAIIDMTTFSKNEHLDNLLVYQDMGTGFVQLRPICSSEKVNSITAELTHIFSDMSPPKMLMIHTSMTSVLTQVLKKLNTIFTPEIKMEAKPVVATDVIFKVNNEISNWLKRTIDGKWCIGCFIVQWELNNVRCKDGETPFERVFGRSVDKGVLKSIDSLIQDANIVNSIDNLQISPPLEVNEFIETNPVLI